MSARHFAANHLGEKETGGHNRSPFIDKLNNFTGVPLGSPYCASGVCWCFKEAMLTEDGQNDPNDDFPIKSASSQAIKRKFQELDRYTTDPQEILGWKGALFGWTNPDGAHGHIGFVINRWTDNGELVAVQTIEFNTNLGGSRDGEGVFSLRRAVPIDGRHRLWFLNTSGLVGGEWFK